MSSRGHRWPWVLGLAVLGLLVGWSLLGTPEAEPPAAGAHRPVASVEPPAPVLLEGRPREPPEPSPAPETAPSSPPPTKGYVIEGTVREVATDAPVLDAEVVGWWESVVARDAHSFESERHDVRAEVLEGGGFRFEIEGTPPPNVYRFELADPAWHVIWVEGGAGGAAPAPQPMMPAGAHGFAYTDVRPGAVNRLTLWVQRVFRIRGLVQDESRRPLPRVRIRFVVPQRGAGNSVFLGGTPTFSDSDGRFDIGPFAYDPAAGLPEAAALRIRSALPIVFEHEGFSPLRIDPLEVPQEQRTGLVVTMTAGVTLAGVLLGPRGRPLADVPVVVEYGDVWQLRRGVRTDREGRWRLERLTPGSATLSARAFPQDLKVRRDVELTADDLDMVLVAEPIRLAQASATTTVLGLALAEVDDDLRRAYEVPDHVKIVILDPGPDPKGLGIGSLEKGYGIWIIGKASVSTVREMLDRLLELTSPTGAHGRERVRIVYTFWHERMAGTNTQYLQLTAEQIEELKVLRERMGPEVGQEDAPAAK